MDKGLAKLQNFEYRKHWPFHVFKIYSNPELDEILPHWHSELEAVYLFGEDDHYIDGQHIHGTPGDFIITNSHAVHKIDTGVGKYNQVDGEIAGIVVLIKEDFLLEYLPDYKKFVFSNKNKKSTPGIRNVMKKISQFAELENAVGEEDYGTYDYLIVSALILQLLYYMCDRGMELRNQETDLNQEGHADSIKQILTYIDSHYMDTFSEKEIAEKFYFSQSYFSRYFKKVTGMTFHHFLTVYRLRKAKEKIDTTSDSILSIALSVGFSDSRRLSLAFQEYYGITPREYRKMYRKANS